MPTSVVKTPEDEKHWEQAKQAAEKESQSGNYAYIMGVYQRIKKNAAKGKLQKALYTHAELKADAPVMGRKIAPVEVEPSTPQELRAANDGRRYIDLYHKTASQNVPSILKDGLIPRYGRPTQGENPAYNAVYFHTDPKRCDDFSIDEPASVLKIKLPLDDDTATRLRPDEDTFMEDAAQSVANGEPVAYRGIVHPSHITEQLDEGRDSLEKSLTRTDAKKVHKDLPPGGQWRTMSGHHVYIKDGKVLAGAVPSVKGAKKATKAQLVEHQATVSKEAGKAKKKTVKAKAPVKAAPTKAPAAKPKAKVTVTAPKKTTKAKVSDIRSEKQTKNEVAYDVGEKVGGSRKDMAKLLQATFKEKPTGQNLAQLEKLGSEFAQAFVVKKNIIPPMDFEAEYKRGTDLNVAMAKQLIYDRVAPKPQGDTPEDRRDYLAAVSNLVRLVEPHKDWKTFRQAMSDVGRLVKGQTSKELVQTEIYLNFAKKEAAREPSQYDLKESRWNRETQGTEYVNLTPKQWKAKKKERVKELEQQLASDKENAAKNLWAPMGDKLTNFFTDYESRNRTYDTIAKKRLTWEQYLNPDHKEPVAKPKGAEKAKWERETVSELRRTGGRKTPVGKPEDMVKAFGMRGVEFGNWVDDASGKFHLIRSAEAFHDLADLLGMKDKDVSLNGRLAMAFGARGKGGAVAHYEPDRKVINMTKHGGAGSLAHEWGHAMDNIMYMHSVGGRGSMNFASESMGDEGDPEIKRAYTDLMNVVHEGDGSGVKNVVNKKQRYSRYDPTRRKMVEEQGVEATIEHYLPRLEEQLDREKESHMMWAARGHTSSQKKLKNFEAQRTKAKNELIQQIANDYYRVHGKELDTIAVPTGQSEYYTRMQEEDAGRKPYWAQGCEMFARVFESYVQDMMKEGKLSNNYLVAGTKASPGAPFPVGEERKMMHGAMDKLVKLIVKKNAIQKALEMLALAQPLRMRMVVRK